jgi:flagellar motor switch protein FliG
MSVSTSRDRISVLLAILGRDVAVPLLEQMPEAVSQQLSEELDRLETNPPSEDDVDSVLDEFLRAVNIASQAVASTSGSNNQSTEANARDKSQKGDDGSSGDDGPSQDSLKALLEASTLQIVAALRGEAPRAVAILLNSLPDDRSAEILENLSEEERVPVFEQMKLRPRVSRALLDRIVDATAKKAITIDIEEIQADSEDANVKMARVLRTMKRKNREQILASLEQRDPDAAAAIRLLIYTFDDVVRFADKALQKLLASIDQQTLSKALVRCDPKIMECVQNNLSKRAKDVLKEEMDLMGSTVDEDSIQEARERIVSSIVELDQRGELSFKDG